MKRLRILHLPATIGGHAPALARAEREIGLDSRCVAFYDSPYGYEPDEVLFEGVGPLVRESRRWRLLARAVRWADIVHFNFGSSLMPRWEPDDGRGLAAYRHLLQLRDVGWLRRLGKGVAVTFQGDDARQGNLAPDALVCEAGYYSAVSDERKRDRIRVFARHAHRIYALNPDLLRVLPRSAEFLPYVHVCASEYEPAPPSASVPLRVAHAPTHRGGKGTRFVLDAVDLLRTEGLAVELDLIEDLPHRTVRDRLATADVLVDQLLLGWYGGISVEAMALAKPVVCFLDEGSLQYVPPGMAADLPVISATPEILAEVLRNLATGHRGELPNLGARGRIFVKRWHDPQGIAYRLERDYRAML